eukprot:2760317-Amphidinium_carterae.1
MNKKHPIRHQRGSITPGTKVIACPLLSALTRIDEMAVGCPTRRRADKGYAYDRLYISSSYLFCKLVPKLAHCCARKGKISVNLCPNSAESRVPTTSNNATASMPCFQTTAAM